MGRVGENPRQARLGQVTPGHPLCGPEHRTDGPPHGGHPYSPVPLYHHWEYDMATTTISGVNYTSSPLAAELKVDMREVKSRI